MGKDLELRNSRHAAEAAGELPASSFASYGGQGSRHSDNASQSTAFRRKIRGALAPRRYTWLPMRRKSELVTLRIELLWSEGKRLTVGGLGEIIRLKTI